MDKVYLELARLVSKSKILPDKEEDLVNSLKFIKECMNKQMSEGNEQQE